MRNNYLSYLTLTPWHYSSYDRYKFFRREEAKHLIRVFPFTKGFGGHTARCYLGYEQVLGRRIDYLTFLRDPVWRYLSHYNYQKKVMGIDWEIHDFLDEKRFDNFMTMRIAGSPDLGKAKAFLAEKFRFVGIVERFNESLILMKNELGLTNLNVCYEPKNASPNSDYRSESLFREDDILDRVYENNRLDIELYQHALKYIYPKYIEGFNRNLKRETEDLAEANRGFTFSKKRRLAWAIYRWACYRIMEYILFRLMHNSYQHHGH